MEAGWTLSDVWILRSIGGVDSLRGSPLRGVIAAADYLNHAIPQEDEFAAAVSRLAAAGLVEFDVAADRYWLTAAGQSSAAHRGTFSAGLAALPEPPPASPPQALPAGVFSAAVTSYLHGST
ncbi:hypothetical protein ACFFX1_44360 [Dactylosporangium sucinum]|uniref:Uncharacterized protein n=1 Tax=Dactylosporangium sucinum TaxID=1424081 RepID=A0A917WWA9_9ACTN|nr:hypothetical protein [Dactylosporangium sucinum]GGM34835.1 hypothetical protein GCM10007977_040430 [Dactylosporangium sucinum]